VASVHHTRRLAFWQLVTLNEQVLELLLDIAQSDGQQDTPFGAALLVGVPVICSFVP
jgi:hypothetical protein